jgi:SpoVK/Ycf46/Vps4 family AAA+-type ATPase
MPDAPIPESSSLFATTLKECRELYLTSGRLCVHEFPDRIKPSGERFVELMDDLHRALVLKVYITVCEADRNWSNEERFLAETLFFHLWGRRLTGEDLRTAAKTVAEQSAKLKWYSLVRPFDQIAPLRDHIGELETLVTRLANVIARADGQLNDREANAIKSIQDELRRHLRPIPIDEPTQHEEGAAATQQAFASIKKDAKDIYNSMRPLGPPSRDGREEAPLGSRPPALEEALAELDGLIGLSQVKDEIRTLTNYLKLQKRRRAAGLPDTEISLHMVFTGNPGTGKTTVARIIGKILGAMEILGKGHLVETDRSGLVAEFMGQTGPKTQKKIDEALDGILFIDEAYSLAHQESQDAFGSEALQALLKRAEDDRERLVVILAGYPDEMRKMLKSNPGLSSRFHRVLHFDDYSPTEMACIFALLCEKNHYRLGAGIRGKLMLGFTELHRSRDRHFGNGRAVRNLFEQAVRRLANRVAEVRELSQSQLMLLEMEDIVFEGLPPETALDSSDDGPWRFRVICPGCKHSTKARGSFLGQQVRCNKCQHEFMADWGEPVSKPAAKTE